MNLQAAHEKMLRNAARDAKIVAVSAFAASSFLIFAFRETDNSIAIVFYSIIVLIGIIAALCIYFSKLFFYIADQSAVIDRQTQQLASIEKRLEDTRQTAKQALAAVNSQKEKV